MEIDPNNALIGVLMVQRELPGRGGGKILDGFKKAAIAAFGKSAVRRRRTWEHGRSARGRADHQER